MNNTAFITMVAFGLVHVPATVISPPSTQIQRPVYYGKRDWHLGTNTFISGPSVSVVLSGFREEISTVTKVQNTDEARRAESDRLEKRIRSFQAEIVRASQEEDGYTLSALDAIEPIVKIAAATPDRVSLPRPMLLSEQISLFWDYGQIYAELAVSGDGSVSAYGKHPSKPELFLDTDLETLAASGSLFPKSLEDFLLPA
jgi:hypothetical protein